MTAAVSWQGTVLGGMAAVHVFGRVAIRLEDPKRLAQFWRATLTLELAGWLCAVWCKSNGQRTATGTGAGGAGGGGGAVTTHSAGSRAESASALTLTHCCGDAASKRHSNPARSPRVCHLFGGALHGLARRLHVSLQLQ